MQPAQKKSNKVLKKNLPTWWLRMSDSQRAAYVKKRPKSKYAKFVNLSKKKSSNTKKTSKSTNTKQKTSNETKASRKVTTKDAIKDARTVLQHLPEDRRLIRSKLKTIAEDPTEVVQLVKKKLTPDNLADQIPPDELKNHTDEIEEAYQQ